MVNVLIKKIDNVNSANIHSVNLWIVQLTISSHCKQKWFNLDTITYTLYSKISSVCNTNCNYLTASVCSERNLILVPLKYQTDSLDSYCSLKPLCSGMGEVVPARTSPTLLPPSPRTVLSLSCFKVLQCINSHDWHCKS